MKKDWKNKGTIMTTILHDEIPSPTSPNLISVFLTFIGAGAVQTSKEVLRVMVGLYCYRQGLTRREPSWQ